MTTATAATKTMKAATKTWDQPNRQAMTTTTTLAIEGDGEWGEGEGRGGGCDMYYRDREALSRARPRGEKKKLLWPQGIGAL